MSAWQEEDGDDALMQRAGRGDAAAFGDLVRRHADPAHATAYRLTGSRGDAEEVVQEAFIRLWQKAAGWRPGEARPGTWLHRVVVNLCLDRLRAGRHRRHEALEAGLEVADPGPDALDRLTRAAARAGMLAAVSALPERQRLALVLTYAGGLGNAEVAEALGISVGAVESLLVRAKRSLRARLAGGGQEEG